MTPAVGQTREGSGGQTLVEALGEGAREREEEGGRGELYDNTHHMNRGSFRLLTNS